MFDSVSNFDYRALLPNRLGDGTTAMDEDSPYGVYEDDESRAQRQDQEEPMQWPDFLSFLPQLSWRERLLGCATCMICGYLLSLGSFVRMKDLMGGNPTPLVINVTFGNILALCGSCFLTGPTQQSRRMFHKSRKHASLVYIGTLAITVLLLITPKHRGKGLLLFTLILCQYAAITWYTLSYVPFARQFVKSCFRRVVSGADPDDMDV